MTDAAYSPGAGSAVDRVLHRHGMGARLRAAMRMSGGRFIIRAIS